MGPAPADSLVTKTKEFYACIKNCFPYYMDSFRSAKLLKNGKILCLGGDSNRRYLKVYNLINKEFSFQYEKISQKGDDMSFEEIDDDILLLAGNNYIYLFDIKKGKSFQTLFLNTYMRPFNYNILKLSNGLILVNYGTIIFFYKYDKNSKILEKIDEYITGKEIFNIWEMRDDNILMENYPRLILFNYKTKQEKSIQLAKDYSRYTDNWSYVGNNIIDNYLLVSYQPREENNQNSKIDIYNIKNNNFIFQSTIEMDYCCSIKKIIKLNDNTLVAYPELYFAAKGNIFIFNVTFDNNELKIIKKDAFVAHEKGMTSISKFDENKVLSSSHDGDIKLWEI